MNYNKIKSISCNIITLVVLCSYCIYAQDCEDGYIYIENLPENLVNNNNVDQCFITNDLGVIDDLVVLNDLDYSNVLEVGVQSWNNGRLFNWVLTYTPNGSNGVNQQLTVLPDNIGNLTNLGSLYLEWNLITVLPTSFSALTNLSTLVINNNLLTSLPMDLGSLTNLFFLDLGYNHIEEIPESIGNLQNMMYLWIFYNQISLLPESICNIPLYWDGYDFSNYPYFASGGNQLCDSSLIPDCVQNSANFEISLDQFYYAFPENASQFCPISDCNDPEAYNCEGSLNGDYSTDIAGVPYDYSCDGTPPPGTEGLPGGWDESCSEGEVCWGYYNPNAGGDNGTCFYYQAPSVYEVAFTVDDGSISLDWSNFEPPSLANVVDYKLQRCIGTGCTPFNAELTEFTDNFDWNPDDDLKYVISVNYENNPYWGYANSEALHPLGLGGCIDPEAYNCEGSLNGDYATDIAGVPYDYSCDGTPPPGTEGLPGGWEESCNEDEVCWGYYNPNAEVNNGSCFYYQAPLESEVEFTIEPGSISLDWSNFSSPEFSNVIDYKLQRCIGTGCTPFNAELTEFTDNIEWNPCDDLKYVISVNYENNPYWGYANSEALHPLLYSTGDMNGDSWWNVLDVVTLANCILAGICGEFEEVQYGCAGDINEDDWYNVLDIVQLANCILSATCACDLLGDCG